MYEGPWADKVSTRSGSKGKGVLDIPLDRKCSELRSQTHRQPDHAPR